MKTKPTTKTLRRITMDCPLCDKRHEVEEKTRTTYTIIKDEEVAYVETFYFCTNVQDDENEFETGSMLNANLMNARNAYRSKKHLLTSDEIVELRENYGLTQVDLANLLGWGEATVSRYESKAIQDSSYDMMLRLVKDDPLQALELLKKNSDKFTMSKYWEIKTNISTKLDTYGKEYLSRKTFESNYVAYDTESDSNGNALLDISRTEAMISYFSDSVPNLYKVKLMKLLWYADVLSYKENGRSISGMVYVHERMGALPIGHRDLMNLEKLNVVEEYNSNYEPMIHILPSVDKDYTVLSSDDISVLERVVNKFKNYNAKEIVEYMHEEKAYCETEFGAVIPFGLASTIRDF